MDLRTDRAHAETLLSAAMTAAQRALTGLWWISGSAGDGDAKRIAGVIRGRAGGGRAG